MNDLATYLAAVQDLYPGGIPLELLKAGAVAEESCRICKRKIRHAATLAGGSPKERNLIFVFAHSDRSGPSSEELDLLRAAVGKGLQRDIGSASFIDIFSCGPGYCGSNAPLHTLDSAALARVLELTPDKLVLLGNTAAEVLGVGAGVAGSKVVSWNNTPTLPTLSLIDVLKDQGCKKEFWTDLKALMVT